MATVSDAPRAALDALARFVRGRVADLAGATESAAGYLLTLAAERQPGPGGVPEAQCRRQVREVTTAGAPFAATPQARARLLRQLHASGLLAADELPCADAALRELSAGTATERSA